MSKNKKILIAIIVLIILVILILIVWFYFKMGGGIVNLNTNLAPLNQTGQLPASTNKNVNTAPITPEEQKLVLGQAEVKRLAMAFAERFGSYSNESKFENIKDAKVMMTDSLASWADNYIKELLQKENPDASYSGVTTKALSVQFSNFDENAGSAKATVLCQKIENKGNTTNPKTSYEKLNLDLKKVDNKWLADNAKWEK